MIGSFRQWHRLPMMTPAAILAGIGGVDFESRSASFFRFAQQLIKKSRPTRIVNALGQAMIVNHAVRVQVFYTDHAVAIDDLAAMLVGEVISPEADTLMHPCYRLTVLPAPWRAQGLLGMLALHLCQGLFLLTEEARVLDFSAIGEGCEGFEAHIHPDVSRVFRQAFGFALNRETGVPLAGTAFLDSECFDLARKRAMQDDLEMPNAREDKLPKGIDLEPKLRIGEAIVAAFALEAGIARLFSGFDTPEKGFHGKIKPDSHVLQHLGMHSGKPGAFLFEHRIGCVLLVEGQALARLLIGVSPTSQQVIVQPPTLFQGFVELRFLLLRWIFRY